MSSAPPTSTPDPKQNDNADEGKLVRQLIAAVILSIMSTLGVGGVAYAKSDLSPEVRALLGQIQTSLTRLEAKMESSDRDVLRLEARVDKAEADIRNLERKGTK